MKYFKVTLRFQYPAWDEKNGIDYVFAAPNKAAAVKHARIQASNDGHMGRIYFTATESDYSLLYQEKE